LSAADFRIVASASGVDDPVLSSLPQEQSILLIIDVSDGFDAALGQIKSFKQRYPAGRVAVLAHQHQLTDMMSAFRVGANAYLANVATCDTFIKSLELVMLGVTLLPPEMLTFISDWQNRSCNDCPAGGDGHAGDHEDVADEGQADDNDVDDSDDEEMVGTEVATNEDAPQAKSSYTPLSPRQRSILRYLIQGDSNKTMARKMAIAEATVKVHVKAILRKIRVHNRTQAAIWAMSNGPFIWAKDDTSGKLPGEPFPSLDVAQIVSAGHKNGSTLSPLKLKEPSHVAPLSLVRLVRKRSGTKTD
jgi:two-component system nitrate/nitrite response regulator NarL